jgi:hypothetical protein
MPRNRVSTRKIKADGDRIMQYELEDVGDAEAFEEECGALPDFSAMFESL